MFNSDNNNLSFIRKIIVYSKSIIDLTLDNNNNSINNKNIIKVSWLRIIWTA